MAEDQTKTDDPRSLERFVRRLCNKLRDRECEYRKIADEWHNKGAMATASECAEKANAFDEAVGWAIELEREYLGRPCSAKIELANGEHVSACHLKEGHVGDHEGWCLGSKAVWAQGQTSDLVESSNDKAQGRRADEV